MQEFALHHRAAAHAGADREVEEGGQSLRRAPTPFTQGCAVHVGIKGNRHRQGRAQRPDDVRASPAGFGGSQDVAVRGGVDVRVQWAKTSDTQTRKRTQQAGLFLEKSNCAVEGLLRGGGWKARFRQAFSFRAADCAHELGTAAFNTAIYGSFHLISSAKQQG